MSDTSPKDAVKAVALPPIDNDLEMDRYYIPVHPDWEVQTLGKGSSFRIANRKTGDRWIITDSRLHKMLEQMARDIHAHCEAISQVRKQARLEAAEMLENMEHPWLTTTAASMAIRKLAEE